MKLFRKSIPEQLAENLVKNERVLAWANHPGGVVAVTNLALISLDHHERVRIPWELTVSGKWDEPLLVVTLQENLGGVPTQRAWNLAQPGLVPTAVRERITTAQVFDQVKEVPEVGIVRFIARQGPQGISWDYLTDENISTDSQTHIKNALSQLRQTLGI